MKGDRLMTENPFEARVKATGLRPKPADMPTLEAMVKDLDRAASWLRGPRSYAQEPLSAFRLKPAAV
jgi:hypothetical protein